MAQNDSLLVPFAIDSIDGPVVQLVRNIYCRGPASKPVIPNHAGQFVFAGGDSSTAESPVAAAFASFQAQTGIDLTNPATAQTYGHISQAAYAAIDKSSARVTAVYVLLSEDGLQALNGAVIQVIADNSVPSSVLMNAVIRPAKDAGKKLGSQAPSGGYAALVVNDIYGSLNKAPGLLYIGEMADRVKARAEESPERYQLALAGLMEALTALVNPVLAVQAPKVAVIGQARLPVTVNVSGPFGGTGRLTSSQTAQATLYGPDNHPRGWPVTITADEFGRAFSLQAASAGASADQITLTLALQGGASLIGAPASDTATAATLKMQVKQGGLWVDVGANRLHVVKDTRLDFQVVAAPNDTPLGVIAWTGPAGPAGSNATASITFGANSANKDDVKAVTVACLGVTLTANVVVYQLTGTLTPDDNFGGRSATDLGLYELVALGATVVPNDLTVAALGGARWEVVTGNSSLNLLTDDGTGRLRAHTAPENLRLRLGILNGPCAGTGPTYDRTIVAPSGGVVSQQPGSGVDHTQFTASVAIWGWFYLRPKDVSFREIYFREGTCKAAANGSYGVWDKLNHNLGPELSICGGSSGTGGPVRCHDDISTGVRGLADFGVGEFTWPIPWEYRVPGGGWTQFTAATHHQTMQANGTAMLEKAGSGQFTKAAADPNSARGPAENAHN